MKKKIIKITENIPSTSQKNNTIHTLNKIQDQSKTKEELNNLSVNYNKSIVTKKIKLKRNIKRVKNKNIGTKISENIIYNNFISRYKNMTINYNSIISDRLINNITSHIVASFKEFLIYGDIFEFLNKYYKKKESSYLLKEIINSNVTNGFFTPNYSILLEKNYLLKNIQEKQRLLENEGDEEKKTEKNKEKADEENIFTSKIMYSILNQTNTSDAINVLGLDNNNNNEDKDIEKIDILIKTVKDLENNNNKNKIFYKKKLIKIGNNNNNNFNSNKICKFRQYVNITDNKPNKLNENNNEDQSKKPLNFELLPKTSIINKYNNINNYSLKNSEGKCISKFNSINNNESNLSNDNFNSINNEKRLNTIEGNKKTFRRKLLFSNFKENDNMEKSLKNFICPYIKPVKQSLSYSKKKIDKNSSNIYNSKKKNNFYKECLNSSLYQKYFNNDINFINKNTYTKKFHKIYIKNLFNSTNSEKNEYINFAKDKNIENDIIKNEFSKTENRIKSYRINKGIGANNLILNSNLNISSSRKSLNKSYSNEANNYSQNTQKICNNIPKNIKRKLFIDEDRKSSINNKYNTNTNINSNRDKTITNIPSITKKIVFTNYEKEKDKNIIEGNNITINHKQNINLSINNVYSTIDNHSRKKIKIVITNGKKMSSEKQKNKNRITIKNNEYFEIFDKNTDKNLTFNYQNSINATTRDINKNTISIINKRISTPQAKQLINESNLKNFGKKSIKYFLNKVNDKNNSYEKIEINNKLNSNYNNPQRISNNDDLNNTQTKNNENKTGKRRKYIVLRDRNVCIYN